ncbi:MAG TPA: glycoside hydrolase family 9 protein [Bacteroidales bacterium]|jgi:hypothetical protein|nr:glycoside hydrolase family 9 protein [Bacteroidales bacterium]
MKHSILKLLVFSILFPGYIFAQSVSEFIAVDQFGYLPNSRKVAFIRDPQVGYDAAKAFTPGNTYALVNNSTKQQVFTGTPQVWNGGATDASSGDKVWWFDFTAYSTQGEYYVLDVQRNVKSYTFKIQENIYKDVLIQAFKTFYYQRFGFAKQAPYAATGWIDGASHMGNLQDSQCRQWGKATDASTQRDVSGGWYDAGDMNKYTSWTAGYIMTMFTMYEENKLAWTDDFQIPESGNGIPDILDEAKYGLDHLLRLQFTNGSCIAVVGCQSASPPSSATGQSLWGGPSTAATLACAAAYAYGAKIFKALGNTTYANTLQAAAIKAWDWAVANPSVVFYNNDSNYGTSGLAAGQQETDDYGRLCKKLNAAAHLFEITGDTKYKTFFESNYLNVNMMQWWYAFPYQAENQDILLYYTTIPNITASVKSEILNRYSVAMGRDNQFGVIDAKTDPYQAHIESYTWGSNNVHMLQGHMFYSALMYNTNPERNAQIPHISEAYIHYIHGANPLNKCYLSNMSAWGAENSVTEFFHSWFKDKSTKWDNTLTSTYGPAPGFLVGGPNPSYDWDGCCPGQTCGSTQNNALCYEMSIEPPKNQPAQKSYKDFNSGWPLNSWSVTENSNGYQVGYLRLLSKYVTSTAPQTQTIQLSQGWNIISLYIDPDNKDVSTMFPVTYTIKTQDGFYSTKNTKALSSIDTIVGGKGYVVYVASAQTFTRVGKPTSKQSIQLKKGWNLIGFPYSESKNIATVIAPIASKVEYVKNFEGFMQPGGSTNSITNFQPGVGYFIKVNADCTLVWE